MDTKVFFGEVVRKAAQIVSSSSLPPLGTPVVIRDLCGRVSIALNGKRSEHEKIASYLEAEIAQARCVRSVTGRGFR